MPLGPDPESGLWEFAHLRSGAPAARDPATGRLAIDGKSGIVFVLIPAGSFWMGAQAGDREPARAFLFFEPEPQLFCLHRPELRVRQPVVPGVTCGLLFDQCAGRLLDKLF